ncbi:alpha/beta hydrolase [Enterococcus sp. HMSC29A04]|uniref:alpha/beta fold hydrolase n=1 Tax=Enterococcus TaxID=1350 RepID=UPI0004825648|nr:MULTISPECIES: alpha/beta hydrolase [Enterococcus]SBA18450.1 2-hydroxy-6-oxo-6-phenylhexa-2,4-dienoate hydrolase [Enterococcus faecium]MDT2571154.1 alpha/beta hydrolase [Enterococcus raffinosus]MZZ64168.1 alpha/beta fold hydrolase [Enterococcus raffinosus]OFT82840.1 alpha/beta hydrolase [Enterococcus sp. HMSC29A04]OFU62809.1 alpha/beta hydrolase [Enterococcus sp. HMSC14A10]
MWINVLVLIILVLLIFEGYQFQRDIKAAYDRLDQYQVKSLTTSFGKMNYLDEGSGEAVLIAHGIFGGYDQGMISLRQVVGDRQRKISPSRFGYIGSAPPSDPTPENQAKAFIELMDYLGIEKCFILGTSAGGAVTLRMALDYPERVKGIILLSSGAPDKKRTVKEVQEMGLQGPPPFIVNDFILWFAMKHFGFVFNKMMGTTVKTNELFETMLPATPRRQGVKADTERTNTDMTLNYDNYPLEDIQVPILVCHAKDDPMADYESIEKMLQRVKAETAICETGGHTIDGNGDFVDQAIRTFIEKKK